MASSTRSDLGSPFEPTPAAFTRCELRTGIGQTLVVGFSVLVASIGLCQHAGIEEHSTVALYMFSIDTP